MTQLAHFPAGSAQRAALTPDVWPIRNERDYDRARDVVDSLIMRRKPTRAEQARMEIFLALMEAFEARHHEIDVRNLGPLDVLRSLLEEHNMTASDLGRLLGNRALGSQIINGKRDLSKAHIRKLADHFSLNPGAFF